MAKKIRPMLDYVKEGIEKEDMICRRLFEGAIGKSSLVKVTPRFDGYIIELETTQRQSLNADKVGEYLDILKGKKSPMDSCSAFFCYAVAVRAKYLQLVLLYYSYNHDQKRVQQEIQSFNYDVWLMAKKFQDHAGIKRATPYLAPFIQKVLSLRSEPPLPASGILPSGAGGWMLPPTNPKPDTTQSGLGWVAPKATVHPSVSLREEKPRKESETKKKSIPSTSPHEAPKKPSASNFLRDLEHNPSVWSTTNNLRPECAGRTLLGNLDSSTKSRIDRALGDFGGIDGMLSGRGMGTPSGSSSNSSVSTSTKVVNGRKQSTKVEMKNGVETIEVTEDGRLVSRTVNGRKVT